MELTDIVGVLESPLFLGDLLAGHEPPDPLSHPSGTLSRPTGEGWGGGRRFMGRRCEDLDAPVSLWAGFARAKK